MPDVDLELLGRQIAVLIDGQREIRDRLGAIEDRLAVIDDRLAETATRDLMLRMLRSFEGQVEVVGIKTELLRETLESRVKAVESRMEALEGKG
jgi:adenine/guanine phosphoribosyltransferase-like PRPP-binding protein